MMFENRQNIDLLNTSKTNCDQLLRELKNLDTLNCRETHKIGNKKKSFLSSFLNLMLFFFSGYLHRLWTRR